MANSQNPEAPAAQPGYTIAKGNRCWRVIDPQGELMCLALCEKGTEEIIRRLEHAAGDTHRPPRACAPAAADRLLLFALAGLLLRLALLSRPFAGGDLPW